MKARSAKGQKRKKIPRTRNKHGGGERNLQSGTPLPKRVPAPFTLPSPLPKVLLRCACLPAACTPVRNRGRGTRYPPHVEKDRTTDCRLLTTRFSCCRTLPRKNSKVVRGATDDEDRGLALLEGDDLPQLHAEAEGVAHHPRQGGHQHDSGHVVEDRVHGQPRQLVGPVQLLEELRRQFEHVGRNPEALPLDSLFAVRVFQVVSCHGAKACGGKKLATTTPPTTTTTMKLSSS